MKTKTLLIALSATTLISSPAFAIKIKVPKIIPKVFEVIISPPIAGGTILYDTLKGDKPGTTLDKANDFTGKAVEKAADVVQKANDLVLKLPRDGIRATLGDDWAKAYDILTASQRIQNEVGSTGGKFLGKCIAGDSCGLQEVAAIPLAAGLKDAYKVYIESSKPIDPQLVQILSHVMPGNIVTSARWMVAKTPDLTIPGFLNAANEARGDGHAVTIGNLIIFSRPPDFAKLGDWVWVLHELRHVEQYAAFSGNPLEAIDGFAVKYLTDHSAMEAEAQKMGEDRAKQLPLEFES